MNINRAATIYRRAVITLGSTGLCALALAQPARADDTDAMYLKMLAHYGITCETVGSPSCTDAGLIKMGHLICSTLEDGDSLNDEKTSLVNHSNGALSQNTATYLISIAVFQYCPDEKKLFEGR
jgi:hypothetical protein